MAETKRGRGRPRKNPTTTNPSEVNKMPITMPQETAILGIAVATYKLLRSYNSLKHPTYDEIVGLENARLDMERAFPELLGWHKGYGNDQGD